MSFKIKLLVGGTLTEVNVTDDMIIPEEAQPKKVEWHELTTWEEICAVAGFDPAEIIPYPTPVYPFQEGLNYMAQMLIITQVLSEGWEPDWTNSNQYKYAVYGTDFKAGFGFSDTNYVSWSTYASVGSRLVFETREKALHAGKYFGHIYNKFFTK